MRAFRLVKFKYPLQETKVPVREPGPGEVLVEVHASGLCHSDIPVMLGIRPTQLPITLGHECAGIVARIGPGVTGIAEGERVSVFYVLACGHCETCRRGLENACPKRRSIGLHQDGGFAEFITVPATNILKLPDSIPFELGAMIGCSVSTAFHAVRLGRIQTGDEVVVIGLGGVGLHVAQIAKIQGASRVIGIDTNPRKGKIARYFGVDAFVHLEGDAAIAQILYLTGGIGVSIAFECVGAPGTYLTALRAVRPGGCAVLAGVCADSIQFQPFPFLLKEVRLLFAVNHTREEQQQVIDMVSNGLLDLSKSITHRLPLSKVQEGFEMLQEGRDVMGNVVVVNDTA